MTRALIPGPTKDDCPCGCGLFGGLRTKVWRGETRGHVRACSCNRCTGGRTKSQARRRENQIAKDLGGARSYASGIVSGYDIGTPIIKIEETANQTLVRGLRRYVESKQFRLKTEKLSAQNTFAWAFAASWDGKARWYVLPAQSFQELHELAMHGSGKKSGDSS